MWAEPGDTLIFAKGENVIESVLPAPLCINLFAKT